MNKEGHIVVAPGVYDGLSARLALAAGAECLYMVSVFSPSPPLMNPGTARLKTSPTVSED